MDILITIQDNVYKTTIDNQELINIYLQNENKDNYIKQLIEMDFNLANVILLFQIVDVVIK